MQKFRLKNFTYWVHKSVPWIPSGKHNADGRWWWTRKRRVHCRESMMWPTKQSDDCCCCCCCGARWSSIRSLMRSCCCCWMPIVSDQRSHWTAVNIRLCEEIYRIWINGNPKKIYSCVLSSHILHTMVSHMQYGIYDGKMIYNLHSLTNGRHPTEHLEPFDKVKIWAID